ncbi:MAG: glycosyltransferase [Lachnospiraceae bacterium]|nr:glycosyltransferase [Lachnospiraceae bacterium]
MEEKWVCTIFEKNKPLVSVIVPVYNVEDYIKKCLDSIVKQTYQNFEVILINDGSKDLSGDICDQYASKYKYIRVYHQENRGVVSARNVGIYNAKGKYVTFIDSDDWVETTFLSVLVEIMEKNQSDIVITGLWRNIDGKDIKILNNISAGVYEKDSLVSFYKKMLHHKDFRELGITPYLVNKLFKRDMLLNCIMNGIDPDIFEAEDHLIVYPYLLHAKKIVVTEDCLYHYVWRASSVTNNRNFNYFENVSKVFLCLDRKFRETKFYDIMRPQLEAHMRMLVFIENPTAFIEVFSEAFMAVQREVFPFRKIPKDSKIILYGAGYLGKIYYNQLEVSGYCDVVAWVDKAFCDEKYKQLGVLSLEVASKLEHDFVVIAIKDRKIISQVKKSLIKIGIQKEKIVVYEER